MRNIMFVGVPDDVVDVIQECIDQFLSTFPERVHADRWEITIASDGSDVGYDIAWGDGTIRDGNMGVMVGATNPHDWPRNA